MRKQYLMSWVCLAAAASISYGADATRYRLTFESIWNAANHPTDFPSGSAHFSGLIGGTHNGDVSFWAPGERSSPGIEAMAETGSKGQLANEVNAAIAAGTASTLISGGGLGQTPGSVSVEFDIVSEYSLVTVTSMIAPSPDWFVGTQSLNLLQENGDWVGKLVQIVNPYDAGTDDGVTFRSANANTSPPEPISRLTGFPFENTGPFGTFTFLRLIEGDYNETGSWDAGDIDAISRALRDGSNDAIYDLNSDEVVNDADRRTLVYDLIGSSLGDSNLDGRFDSGDLIDIFAAGEYEDAIAGNSTWETGDWNGDTEFDTNDLIAALAEGAYEADQLRAVSVSVSEPSSILSLIVGMTGLLLRGRKVTQVRSSSHLRSNPMRHGYSWVRASRYW